MASGTYTVSTDPIRGREYTNKHKTQLTVWRLGLENAKSSAPDGLFELHKKEGNAPPSVGEQLDVDRHYQGQDNQGVPFTRLYLASQQGQQQSSGGSGGGGGKFDRRPEHPRNEARMIHTSSLSAAPTYIEQMLTMSVVEQPKDEDAYWKLVDRVVFRLTRSYDRAMESEPAQQTLNGEAQVQADTEGLEPQAYTTGRWNVSPQATPADETIPF